MESHVYFVQELRNSLKLLPLQGATAPTRDTQGVASLALGYVLHWAFSPPLLNSKLEFVDMYRSMLASCTTGRISQHPIRAKVLRCASRPSTRFASGRARSQHTHICRVRPGKAVCSKSAVSLSQCARGRTNQRVHPS